MKQASLLLSTAALFAIAVSAQTFDYAKDIGLAVAQSGNTWCAILRDSALVPGTLVQLAWVPVPTTDDAPEVLAGVIRERLPKPCSTDLDYYQHHSYLLEVRGTSRMRSPYFVLARAAKPLAIKASSVVGDVDGDGVIESLRICTSHEGLHFTVWSGEPLKGKRRFHQYYHLDYDVEPTCTEADYSDK